jgi:hypothetical protein
MNLASPAPKVEPAVATVAPVEEPAIAEQAVPCSDAVHAQPAQQVDPAVPSDNPMEYAPVHLLTTNDHLNKPLSVQKLRETNHNDRDFECEAAVIRGKPTKNFLRRFLPWIFEERDFVAYGEVRKYIYVKDIVNCFIFNEIDDPIPLYAIDLSEYNAVLEDPNHLDPESFTISPVPNSNKARPEMITVLLKDKKTKVQTYQFTFDTSKQPKSAKFFFDMFTLTRKNTVNNDSEKKMKKKSFGTNFTQVGAVSVDGATYPSKKSKTVDN